MSHLIDVVCLIAVISGIVLFLYGANYYNNVIGWTGVYLFVGSILARIGLFIYSRLNRKAPVQNS